MTRGHCPAPAFHAGLAGTGNSLGNLLVFLWQKFELILLVRFGHDENACVLHEGFFVSQAEHPDGKSVRLDWDRVRLFDKDVAQMFVNLIKAGDGAR